MRLARLVAAGLTLGALAGFLAGLLRPRTVQTYPVPVDHVPIDRLPIDRVPIDSALNNPVPIDSAVTTRRATPSRALQVPSRTAEQEDGPSTTPTEVVVTSSGPAKDQQESEIEPGGRVVEVDEEKVTVG